MRWLCFASALVLSACTVSPAGAQAPADWSQRQPFDSLMFGSVDESIMAIDSFRALDTTRIFAARVRNPQRLEDGLISSIPARWAVSSFVDRCFVGQAAAAV